MPPRQRSWGLDWASAQVVNGQMLKMEFALHQFPKDPKGS